MVGHRRCLSSIPKTSIINLFRSPGIMEGRNPVRPLVDSVDTIITSMETALNPSNDSSTDTRVTTSAAKPTATSAPSSSPTTASSSTPAPNSVAQAANGDAPSTAAAEDAPKKQKKKKEKKPKPPAPPTLPPEVSQFLQCDLRVGRVTTVDTHPEADGLYILEVSYGDELPPRPVCAGLRNFLTVAEIENRRVVTICNLKPRKLRGVSSEAMILAGSVVSGDSGAKETVVPIMPPADAADGAIVGVRDMEGERTVVDGKFVSSKTWDKVVPRLSVVNGAACYDGKPLIVGGVHVACNLPDGAEIH